MADRNIVQIRHGSEDNLNSAALEKYELGFSNEGALYINNNGTLIPIGGNLLASSMFGTSDPPTTGAREGQVYFRLIEE